LIGDPVYFSLFTPRPFNSAVVTIVYRDHLSSSTPLVELGLLRDKVTRRYELKPLDNKILDTLMAAGGWRREGETIFWQANGAYADLNAFQADLDAGQLKDCSSGPNACLAVYNYALTFPYNLPKETTVSPLELKQPLRGAEDFYVYVSNNQLRLDFNFVDLNQDKAPDPITVNLYRGGELVNSQFLPDDNPRPASGISENKTLSLKETNLSPGVYKVEVKITDDVVIKNLKSSVGKLAFINKVWPVSTNGDLKLFTDANYLQAKAFTPASLQTLFFAGQDFSLSVPYEQFTFTSASPAPVKEIKLTKDDVILENNGVFSWSAISLFDPTLKKVDSHFVLTPAIKYIVAAYQPPSENEGWQTAQTEFDLVGAYRENGRYGFLISIPGLRAEDGTGDYLEIKEIKVELTGRTLWQKIKALL